MPPIDRLQLLGNVTLDDFQGFDVEQKIAKA